MLQGFVKGTDIRIVGRLDTLTAVCNITGFSEPGVAEESGESEVNWNSQKAVIRDGGSVYVCENGVEHAESQIEFREVEDD